MGFLIDRKGLFAIYPQRFATSKHKTWGYIEISQVTVRISGWRVWLVKNYRGKPIMKMEGKGLPGNPKAKKKIEYSESSLKTAVGRAFRATTKKIKVLSFLSFSTLRLLQRRKERALRSKTRSGLGELLWISNSILNLIDCITQLSPRIPKFACCCPNTVKPRQPGVPESGNVMSRDLM
jgi:hypothetical protein